MESSLARLELEKLKPKNQQAWSGSTEKKFRLEKLNFFSF
jgi:hypothetical protein